MIWFGAMCISYRNLRPTFLLENPYHSIAARWETNYSPERKNAVGQPHIARRATSVSAASVPYHAIVYSSDNNFPKMIFHIQSGKSM